MMTLQQYQQKLKEYRLEHHRERLDQVIKPCIRLEIAPVEDSGLPLGCSKMGGRPDLPAGLYWPTDDDGNALSFIAQINCVQMAALEASGLLPRMGIIYFFYDAVRQPWGFDPADRAGFKVLYSTQTDGLLRPDFPPALDQEGIFKTGALTLQPVISMPVFQDALITFLSSEEEDRYFDLFDDGIMNKLLGYPDQIQEDMQSECALVTSGIYCGDGTGYKTPRARELRLTAGDWQLLLQVDSNEALGMQWGDVGRLYFWIRKEDLQNCRFERCWVILQCY